MTSTSGPSPAPGPTLHPASGPPVTPPPVAVVGLVGGEWFGRVAGAALAAADTLVGDRRHLDALARVNPELTGRRVPLAANLADTLDAVAHRRARGEMVCLLTSGDPGFFGLARLATARLGPGAVHVHPAPSSVALAFARIGLGWDDAVVVSVHGRPLAAAVEAIVHQPDVAVLTSPENPPERLGRELVSTGCGPRWVTVCARLGEPDEAVTGTDLDGLAAGRFDPLAVVVFRALSAWDGDAEGSSGTGAYPSPAGSAAAAERPPRGVSWGLSEDAFAHRAGMVTHAEVRAVALGKLALPPAGVLWDVGAGSGSVGIECARVCPALRVFAVERRADDAARIRSNAVRTGVVVVEGEAPDAFAGLPDPDRVFVGGGGLAVLDAALDRLRPGGTVVATYAVLDRAVAAAGRLGNLVQLAVSRAVPIGPAKPSEAPPPPGSTATGGAAGPPVERDGTGGRSLRLAAENPVFIAWGPRR